MNDHKSDPLNINDIVQKYQKEFFGKKYLYLTKDGNKKDKRLLIVMSTHNQGEKYMALRGFIENQKCDLLFINNPENTWYLDNDTGETYASLLIENIKDYEPCNVFFFGSSMSGYASIFFALRFNANAISVNPQVNLNVSKDYSWDELKQHIHDIPGDVVNLDAWCVKNWQDSVVYLMHGHDDIDVVNTRLFLNAMPSRRKIIVQTVGLDSHAMFFGKDTSQVYAVLNLVEQYRKIAAKEIESAGMTDALKQKSIRRQRRNELAMPDPYRDAYTQGDINWQHRYLYEDAGRVINFKDVGLYSPAGTLSGALCQFDGVKWNLISPKLDYEHNIIANWSFVNDTEILQPVDNQYICPDAWWVRNNCLSKIDIQGGNGLISLKINEANSKNIYLALSIDQAKVNLEFYKKLEGKYLTFSSEISSSCGGINLVLGGVSDAGYHHRNSDTHDKIGFAQKSVFEQFFDININHKEPIFVRFNVCPDGKEKVVKIRNPMLVLGYFPMGM